MLATYGSAALIVVASAVTGQALLRLTGTREWRGYCGAVGLAALMAIASASVKLPGDGTAAAVTLAVVTVACAAWLARDLPRPPAALTWALGATGLLTLLPFAAAGRFGLLGVSVNNDSALHLAWSEFIRTGGAFGVQPSPGYPTGAHALVAGLSDLLGSGQDWIFTGLMVALALLAAGAFWTLLDHLRPPARALGTVVVSLCFLMASYLAQSAFKELTQVLLLAGLIGLLRGVSTGRVKALGAALAAGVLLAGVVLNYSYTGLAWPIGVVAVWAVAARATRARAALAVPEAARAALLAGATMLVVLAPELADISRFAKQLGTSPAGTGAIQATDQGNLFAAVPSFEAFGVWPVRDFRFAVDPLWLRYLLCAFGLSVALAGGVWCLRRGRLHVAAAGAATAAIYLAIEARESAYLAAKGLAILAPFAALVAVSWLLAKRDRRTVVAVAFVAVALLSTVLALTGAAVGPREPTDQLAPVRDAVRGSSVLALVGDDYLRWELRTASRLSSINFVARRPQKLGTDNEPVDLDTVPDSELNRYRYVLTTNTPYASVAPAQLRPAIRTPLFILWKRSGRVPRRSVANEGFAPGRVLDCSAIDGREGYAAIRPAPVAVEVEGAARFVNSERGLISFRLPAGRWELSLRYFSAGDLQVSAGGARATLSPVLDRGGSYRRALAVSRATAGRVALRLRVDDPSILPTKQRGAVVLAVAATRSGAGARIVPLRRACGRYVDWYTLGRARPSL